MWNRWLECFGILLLFALVFGMSATVDMAALKQQIRNRQAILTGLLLQFGILPLLGFGVVVGLQMDATTGLLLLVLTSSPGGSYSNWWCSMFNGDLALSVTMTAVSTVASTVLMPLNLYFYYHWAYPANQAQNNNNENNDDLFVEDTANLLRWSSVFGALGVVLLAIGLGLLASATFREANFNLRMNQLGNFAGLALIVVSAILSNMEQEARLWNREWEFYFGVPLPCVMALGLANLVTTALQLDKPERVTVSIECGYQNVGIATSLALTMLDGEEQARALAVPFYYGMVEAMVLLLYCLVAWKAGWTKSPKSVPIWQMLLTSYEVVHANHGDIDPEYQNAYYHHQDDEFQYPASTGRGKVRSQVDPYHGSPIQARTVLGGLDTYTTPPSSPPLTGGGGEPSPQLSTTVSPQPDYFMVEHQRRNKEFSPA